MLRLITAAAVVATTCPCRLLCLPSSQPASSSDYMESILESTIRSCVDSAPADDSTCLSPCVWLALCLAFLYATLFFSVPSYHLHCPCLCLCCSFPFSYFSPASVCLGQIKCLLCLPVHSRQCSPAKCVLRPLLACVWLLFNIYRCRASLGRCVYDLPHVSPTDTVSQYAAILRLGARISSFRFVLL